jgi:hypothetical protein
MTDLETARRDAVARLCFAQASGLLSVETFGERYALVADATSVATLEALIADLAPDDATPLPVGTRSVAIQTVHDDYDYPTSYTTRSALAVAAASSIRIPAVFGSAVRAGTWTVPEHVEVMATLGEGRGQFRQLNVEGVTTAVETSWAIQWRIDLITKMDMADHRKFRNLIRFIMHTQAVRLNGASPMANHKIHDFYLDGGSTLMISSDDNNALQTSMIFNGDISVQDDAWAAIES